MVEEFSNCSGIGYCSGFGGFDFPIRYLAVEPLDSFSLVITTSIEGYHVSLNAVGLSIALPDTQSATPLPAAFPLFATGLGVLGLLGWRRKRSNAA